uniref:Si:ch211-1e14.1 n=1 Tax=Amphilophus citrinellus TaxID=61819 RepID=A0A3Q0RK17_AMPCI
MGFLGDIQSPTGSSPLALPNSHYTAFESPDSPGALPSIPEPSHEARTADNIYRGNIAYENSKTITSRDASSGEPHILTTPSLSPSVPVLESGPQFQGPAKLSLDWKMTGSSLFQTQTKSPLEPWENISITSLSPSAFARSAPQLGLNSEKNASFSKQLDGASEKTLGNMTLQSEQPLETLDQTFTDFLADESHTKPMHAGSSSAPLEKNRPAYDINMLPNPDEILSPGYKVPFITPHPTSPSSEPTELSPEYFYPSSDMEVDWGSGDYLETTSFFSSDREDYSLVTKLPSDAYDLEDYTESYDTSFPSRVGISPSSLYPLYISPSSSLTTAYSPIVSPRSIYPSSFSTTVQLSLEPTPTANSDVPDISDIDWPDTYTIQPTDVLLPDMNSLEYYNIQLTKENNSSETGAEHRGNITVVPISTTDNTATNSSSNDTKLTEDDLSGFEPHDGTTNVVTTEESPQLVNASQPFLDPSIVPTHSLYSSSSFWDDQVSTTDWSAHTLNVDLDSTPVTKAVQPSATPLLPDDLIFPSSLTYVHWFVTESFSKSTIDAATVLTPTVESHNVTVPPPFVMGDQGVTEDGADTLATLTYIPASSEVNEVSTAPTSTAATTTPHQATTRIAATSEASTIVTIIATTGDEITAAAPTSRSYLCNINKPDYLVKIGFPSGATVGYAKSQIGNILKGEFDRSVELQVVDPPPKFVFRVVSGPIVYTAISVVNALQRSGRQFLSVSPNWSTPDRKYQVHSVLQFVPGHIDVRFCNFSENIERGLTMAFAEVRRRSTESTNITVHIVNITMATPTYEKQKLVRNPVHITFTVHSSSGYLMGSEISNALMKLTMVEFSYYMGFPVLQIAEPFHYPELNTSQLLRSSWVRTVLLGVLDQKVGEKTFQANMERRLAMLLGEAMGSVRRVKRATTIGNSSVQVIQLVGDDHPLEIVYFVEGPSGQRIPAVQTANLLNTLDVQRAAIVLGYRVQGILAQPVEKLVSSPSDNENTNVWIIIGVVIPLLVVIIIISILYWKLCRTDKLEFQPDAMTSIQQRQKLQAPTVKGFDFAKLHLGQQSKDDVMVIQEPVPPGLGSIPKSIKDGLSPSENGEIPTPISKTSASSTKASRSGRRRGRISSSDGDSVLSEHSSERESTEENLRAQATPSDSKQTRKVPINVLNGPPPPMSDTNEQLSSASIFEHVDRMSRATDASKRLPNKVQLIAMQPMPVPPLHSPPINGKLSDTSQMTKEIQVALRHKSEIEHHRNKIRLRAKRKGHYDFPAMDDMITGFGDAKDQDRIYQKEQMQIDKILDPDAQMPSVFMEPKKSGRGRRSPKQRMKDQMNGGMMEADKDHLITEDSDAAYRKCPGVNNVAYVSDPDQGPGSPHRSPSPTDDVFPAPTSSPPGHAPPPPPYMPPQPSIEEARQQMHSLLDDAFALVSPTSQGSTAGITLPGVNSNPPNSSPPGRGPRPWGLSYQVFPNRFTEMGMPSTAVQGMAPRQGLGSSYLPPGETAGHSEQLQPDSLYSSRGLYADELPSCARPRPVGGTTGAQLHHLAQVGLSSRMNGYPAGGRIHRSAIREPTAPLTHLDGVGYLTAPPPLDTSPPTHSSASLIKAIREELLRLSQKQAAVPSYHS